TSQEDTECAQTHYVEIGTRGLIPCSCNGSSLALIAWVNVNEGKTLLLRHDDVKRGDGYESGEYDIYPDGSLVINNVTASHESVYRVSTAISIFGSRISKNICVHTTATSLEDTECAQTHYVDIGTRALIPCSCNGSYLPLIAWVNVNEGKTLLLLDRGEKSGDGYESTEYDIYPNGSLLINNVTASHESVYRVSTATSTSGSRISNVICVHTTGM
ncbi:putative immunoglobulin superfamily member 10 isoform X2, partial [Apostichopus japonicus]